MFKYSAYEAIIHRRHNDYVYKSASCSVKNADHSTINSLYKMTII